MTALAKRLTTLRFGIDYDAMHHLRHAPELSASTPILLVHGSDDPTVPASHSEKRAEARPNIVDYHLFPGLAHVSSWNHERERYEAAGGASSMLSPGALSASGPAGRHWRAPAVRRTSPSLRGGRIEVRLEEVLNAWSRD